MRKNIDAVSVNGWVGDSFTVAGFAVDDSVDGVVDGVVDEFSDAVVDGVVDGVVKLPNIVSRI
ncbi:MAG: hypothetical protein OXU98_04820 [Gammaproteobacteria bacterium]|nr:hypothetical protein [Gammaproteobacteria bacterium]